MRLLHPSTPVSFGRVIPPLPSVATHDSASRCSELPLLALFVVAQLLLPWLRLRKLERLHGVELPHVRIARAME